MPNANLACVSLVAALLGLFCGAGGQGRAVHRSPCPSIFDYEHDGQKWFGSITIPAPKYGSEARLRVTMSLAAKLPTKYSGTIELAGEKSDVLNKILRGSPITYTVNFPLLWPIPKLTGIYFNGRLICSGPPENFGGGVHTLTDISLDHTLNTGEDAASPGGTYDYYPVVRPTTSPPPMPTWGGSIPTYGDDRDNAINNFIKEFLQNNQGSNQPPAQQPGPASWPQEPATRPTVTQPPPPRPKPPQPKPPQPTPPAIESRPSNSEYHCGNPIIGNPLVIQGERTSKGIWPWMVAMYIRRPEILKFHCSGTLISSRHVLTAAQCMTDQRQRLTVNNVLIKLGVFDLQDWGDSDVRQMTLSAINIHPKFNKNTLQHDITLLTLSQEAKFSDYIIPVCMWDSDDDASLIDGQEGTVVGWGRDENGESTLDPRVGKIPMWSTETCRANSAKHFPLTSNMTLCAGARDGTGPCNGDSGTGVFMYKNNRWYIRGIVSTALSINRICDLTEYVVLVDVAKYIPWIRDIILTVV